MSAAEADKRRAAERAVELIEDGMTVGLGSGSTARHVMDVLADRRRDGLLRNVVGVATSRATAAYARDAGLPLATLDERPHLDLTLDGADEVDPALDLIKGLGGALLWEKIVATASDRLAIVVDGSKRVERLGRRAPLPIEVVPFGWRTHLPFLKALGCRPEIRLDGNGEAVVTDGGHHLIDCHFEDGIEDVHAVDAALHSRVGVVETGLFLGMADCVVIAEGGRVTVLERT